MTNVHPFTTDPLDSAQPLSTSDAEEKRRRGGQPGNQNARTHGFYAECLAPEEQDALYNAVGIKDLSPEIALMRVKLMNLITHPSVSDDTIIRAVRALTRMIDVQHHITRLH